MIIRDAHLFYVLYYSIPESERGSKPKPKVSFQR